MNYKKVPYKLLVGLSELLELKTGIYFPRKRFKELESKLLRMTSQLGYKSFEELLSYFFTTKLTDDDIKQLACHFSVTETYFYRSPEYLRVINELMQSRYNKQRLIENRTLRIWCAGCSTGEEPYSIAIHLLDTVKDIKDWNITILATDINPEVLKKARNGLFSHWSFRSTPDWVIRKHFTKHNSTHLSISPQIKEMVTFSYLNLAEDVFPSITNGTNSVDIIFCRNVLMYFSYSRIKEISSRFYKCLVDDGILVTSPSETFHFLTNEFQSVQSDNIVFYMKSNEKNKTRKKNNVGSISYFNNYFHADKAMFEDKPVTVKNGTKKQYVNKAELKNKQETKGDINQAYINALGLFTAHKYEHTVNELLTTKEEYRDSKINLLLAEAYANMGLLEEAIKYCRIAINLDKLNARQYYLYATILTETGEPEEAVKQLKRSIYINPDFILSHYLLGNLYLQMGSKNIAIKSFNNALRLLGKLKKENVIDDSEGITAGGLGEIIKQNMENLKTWDTQIVNINY